MPKVELIVPIVAKEGQSDALRKELHAMLAPTHAEPGNEFYRLYESENSGHFFFHELWESPQALDEHMKTPHFQNFEKAVRDLLAEPLTIHKVKEIS